jgi:hypothetical protein
MLNPLVAYPNTIGNPRFGIRPKAASRARISVARLTLRFPVCVNTSSSRRASAGFPVFLHDITPPDK